MKHDDLTSLAFGLETSIRNGAKSARHDCGEVSVVLELGPVYGQIECRFPWVPQGESLRWRADFRVHDVERVVLSVVGMASAVGGWPAVKREAELAER